MIYILICFGTVILTVTIPLLLVLRQVR